MIIAQLFDIGGAVGKGLRSWTVSSAGGDAVGSLRFMGHRT
jgi:hypothetical protein